MVNLASNPTKPVTYKTWFGLKIWWAVTYMPSAPWISRFIICPLRSGSLIPSSFFLVRLSISLATYSSKSLLRATMDIFSNPSRHCSMSASRRLAKRVLILRGSCWIRSSNSTASKRLAVISSNPSMRIEVRENKLEILCKVCSKISGFGRR